MAWIVMLGVAMLYLAVLRYGVDSRDGLDWRTTAGPSLRQGAAPRPGSARPELRRARPSPHDDLLRLLGLFRG